MLLNVVFVTVNPTERNELNRKVINPIAATESNDGYADVPPGSIDDESRYANLNTEDRRIHTGSASTPASSMFQQGDSVFDITQQPNDPLGFIKGLVTAFNVAPNDSSRASQNDRHHSRAGSGEAERARVRLETPSRSSGCRAYACTGCIG